MSAHEYASVCVCGCGCRCECGTGVRMRIRKWCLHADRAHPYTRQSTASQCSRWMPAGTILRPLNLGPTVHERTSMPNSVSAGKSSVRTLAPSLNLRTASSLPIRRFSPGLPNGRRRWAGGVHALSSVPPADDAPPRSFSWSPAPATSAALAPPRKRSCAQHVSHRSGLRFPLSRG